MEYAKQPCGLQLSSLARTDGDADNSAAPCHFPGNLTVTTRFLRTCLSCVSVAAGLMLGGCRGSVSTDLNADAPASPQIVGINVDVLGVEFQKADGGTEKLEFTDSEPTDLIELLDNGSVRLFTNEELADGTYTGVRLLLQDDDNASVVRVDGSEFPTTLAEGAYAAVDFTVAEDESSQRELVLTIDLRKSLRFDDDNNEYTLTPTLRVVDATDAGSISGTINVTCPVGTSLQQGGAVYLFASEDVDPTDIDGTGTEPVATTSVLSGFGSGFSYALQFLPPGRYTIALTCEGHNDDPGANDDLDFVRTANVRVERDDVVHSFN